MPPFRTCASSYPKREPRIRNCLPFLQRNRSIPNVRHVSVRHGHHAHVVLRHPAMLPARYSQKSCAKLGQRKLQYRLDEVRTSSARNPVALLTMLIRPHVAGKIGCRGRRADLDFETGPATDPIGCWSTPFRYLLAALLPPAYHQMWLIALSTPEIMLCRANSSHRLGTWPRCTHSGSDGGSNSLPVFASTLLRDNPTLSTGPTHDRQFVDNATHWSRRNEPDHYLDSGRLRAYNRLRKRLKQTDHEVPMQRRFIQTA